METLNANDVLMNVNKLIDELESLNNEAKRTKAYVDYDRERIVRCGYFPPNYRFKISEVYDECNIFDWWREELSVSQLKQMKSFLVRAIKLGFTGYVCFKVGAIGCSHGMWAHKEQSTDGYSPDGDVLFHSFRCDDNYWDGKINGVWMHEKYEHEHKFFTLRDIKKELAR